VINAGGCKINIEETMKVGDGNYVVKVRITATPGFSMRVTENTDKKEVLLTFKKPAANQTCVTCLGKGYVKYKSGEVETCIQCNGKGLVTQKT